MILQFTVAQQSGAAHADAAQDFDAVMVEEPFELGGGVQVSVGDALV